MRIKIRELLRNSDAALGATLAQDHMREVYGQIAEDTLPPGSLIIFDFDGVKFVNGSYIRSSVLWLLTCGQLSTSERPSEFPPKHREDVRPYDVFTCLSGLSRDVEAEFQEFFKPRKLPVLCGRKFQGNELLRAVVLGHLDVALRSTLEAVVKAGKATAPMLYENIPEEKITVTAWNNRLNDLHSLRLVRRMRVGRGWEYQALAKEIVWE